MVTFTRTPLRGLCHSRLSLVQPAALQLNFNFLEMVRLVVRILIVQVPLRDAVTYRRFALRRHTPMVEYRLVPVGIFTSEARAYRFFARNAGFDVVGGVALVAAVVEGASLVASFVDAVVSNLTVAREALPSVATVVTVAV